MGDMLEQELQAAKRRTGSREMEKIRVADCVTDLYGAMLDAGGDPRGLLDMTLREFVVRVAAQNEIRFVHWPTHLRRRARVEEDQDLPDRVAFAFSVGDKVYDSRDRSRVGEVSSKASLRLLVRWEGERECWIHIRFAMLLEEQGGSKPEKHESTGDPLLDELLEEHEKHEGTAQS